MLLRDGDGLYLRKQTRDGASWTLRCHFAGREHWLTLGDYPAMSLAQARVEAREARVLLDKQQDPLGVRRATRAAQRQRGSFRELCEESYRNEIIGREIKHPSVPRRHLDKYLLPKLGRTAAAEVTAADIARVIDEIKGRAPTAANDLLRFAHRNLCLRRASTHSPRQPGLRFLAAPRWRRHRRPRSRALSLDELGQLFEKVREAPSFGAANALALKLLLALCVRKGELLGAWATRDSRPRSPGGRSDSD